ncbi:Thioredoxin F, chloroplastic [Zostera marina]|uniref:Thioredoxin F, chloroplastic n=1 Tax=Zostera marina TaxID=29655 RepID=A0A0K9PLN3_ZOSMR|nr:Thioredoxin F, chloroplastic [Zostera marina]
MMALGITIPSSTIPTLRSPCCSGSIGQASLVFVPRKSAGGIPRGFLRKEERGVVLKCGVNMGCVATVGEVTDVDKDTFWPIVETAAPKIVVVDMYTQWCGPCKIIAPKYKELSEKYLDVTFLKLDCNQENKTLAKELGIRVVPTFKILKDGKIVKEVTGAKIDALVQAIDAVLSGDE